MTSYGLQNGIMVAAGFSFSPPISVSSGGTGATTLTGVLTGNGTSPFTASPVTQFDVLVGGSSNSITSIAPSATSGVPLISQGAASNPVFGTTVVAGGGTGATSLTGLVIGNDLLIQVQGVAAENWVWMATIRYSIITE